MSFGVWIEVPCAVCSVTGPGLWTFDNCLRRRELSKQLKKSGWHHRGDDWLCRSCSNEEEPRP